MSEQDAGPKSSLEHPITAFEQLIVQGNLAGLTADQRVKYYRHVCESLGINYLTRPFEYLTVQGRMILYARRDATDQLRNIHGVSIRVVARERFDDVYAVTAQASLPDGRTDEAIGTVSLTGLRGTDLANAFMKAETKAKRRVTLSIIGLGWSDETEVETLIEGFAKQPMKALAPPRKFADMPEDQKRGVLRDIILKAEEDLRGKGFTEGLPVVFTATDDLEFLVKFAALARVLPKEEEGKIPEAVVALRVFADAHREQVDQRSADTNGDDRSSPES